MECVESDRILDDIRDGFAGSVERIHLLTKQDINNIKNRNASSESLACDRQSVELWVKSQRGEKGNPVLHFKQ